MPELKYLFEAHLKDGTVIQQTQADVSQTNPTKSAFYDVQERMDDVVFFGLFSDTATYLVDLADGHFEIDGKPFHIRDAETMLPEDTKFRLIYFRKNFLSFNAGFEEIGHDIQYFLGWQATVAGKNHQQTIVVE